MLSKYSLVFQPDDKTITEVQAMKLQLSEHIGWFHSKNALAHLTICEFQATEQDVDRIRNQVTRCCNRFSPIKVHMHHFNTYSNGAFFLEVDPLPKKVLQDYARQLFEELQLQKAYKCNDPHLSIARKLHAAQIETAYSLWRTPQISFICQSIALRKLNLERRQFDIVELFPFLAQEDLRETQLTLF